MSFIVLFCEQTLVQCPPTVSIDFDEHTGARSVTTLRSKSEVGTEWASPAQVSLVQQNLRCPTVIAAEAGDNNMKEALLHARKQLLFLSIQLNFIRSYFP